MSTAGSFKHQFHSPALGGRIGHRVTMAMAEYVGEMAAGQQTAVELYMFEPESDPEQEESPEESQQPRMNVDVSQ